MLKQRSDMYGSDDWLAEEIRRENRVSAWDMDGGRLLREEHEAACDARRLAAEHALGCDAEANAEAHRREHTGSALDAGFREAMKTMAAQEDGSMTPESRKKLALGLFGAFFLMILIPPLAMLMPALAAGYAIYAAKQKKQ